MIWLNLVHRVPMMRPAYLPGYSRYRVKGKLYPAILPSEEDDVVVGVLLQQITQAEMDSLDQYEGDEYRREATPVSLYVSGTTQAEQEPLPIPAYVWVWAKSTDLLDLTGPDWDLQEFENNTNLFLKQEFEHK